MGGGMDTRMKGAAGRSQKWDEANRNIFDLSVKLPVLQDWWLFFKLTIIVYIFEVLFYHSTVIHK